MSDTPLIIGGMEIQTGFYIDSYRYQKPIGYGGMAEVLLTYDPSNRPFAIKVLKANRFKVGRRRFSREFRTLSKMHHPNVIQVDSYGDIYGHPYIAMEYINGTDLHKEIRSFRDKALADRWERIREIIIDLCRGLEHIHSHGVVHRDLKPSNILIEKDGRCVITDFGIVKELNSDVEKSAALVGTWAYASPEQITGQELDHRSDLYSLGIILYAMLCSRRPFAASNMAGYSKLHSEQQPRTPSDFIPEIPTLYEDICLKLLEKSPQDRYQSAREVLIDLGEIQEDRKARESMVEKIPFFKTDLSVRFLRTIQQSHCGTTIMVGEEGFGKSKILESLERRLLELNLPHIRIRMTDSPAPFESGGQLIQYVVRESGDESLYLLWQQYAAMTTKTDRNLLAQLCDMTQSVLRRLLEDRAQIILIDDFHCAQKISLEFFSTLWERLAVQLNLPLFFFITTNEPVSCFNKAEILPLRLLDKKDVITILSDMTNNQSGLDIISEKILEETDGIPLFLNAFIQQLLVERVLVKEGSVYRFSKDPQTIAQQTFNVPPSIRQIVSDRLSSVSPVELSILKMLAVAGREIHIDLLLHLSDVEDNELFDGIDELIKSRLIVENKKGVDEYFRLRRRKYGSVLYDSLPQLERAEFHKKIAEFLESSQTLQNIHVVQQIGEHFRSANIAGKAYQYLALAAIRLFERGLHQSALQNVHYAHPLTKLAKQQLNEEEFSRSRLRFLRVCSSMAHNQGEWKEALKHLKTQLRYARSLKLDRTLGETKLAIGDAYTRLGQIDKGIQKFQEVLKDGQATQQVALQIEAYYQLCGVTWNQGNTKQALEYAQTGLSLTLPNELSLPRAKILLSVSSLKAHLGQLTIASSQMMESAKILRQLTQKELLGLVLCNLAEVLLWRGLWQEAHAHALESLELSKDTFYQIGQAHAHLILAKITMERGFYGEATQHAKHTARISQELNVHDLEGLGTYILGQIQIELDNPSAALPLLKSSRESLQGNDPEKYQLSVYLTMALAFIDSQQISTAKAIIESIREYLGKAPLTRQIENKYWLARCEMMLGNTDIAIQLCLDGDHSAERREMWGWSMKFKALLINLSNNPLYKEKFDQLFQRLSVQLPEEERKLMAEHIQYVHD